MRFHRVGKPRTLIVTQTLNCGRKSAAQNFKPNIGLAMAFLPPPLLGAAKIRVTIHLGHYVVIILDLSGAGQIAPALGCHPWQVLRFG